MQSHSVLGLWWRSWMKLLQLWESGWAKRAPYPVPPLWECYIHFRFRCLLVLECVVYQEPAQVLVNHLNLEWFHWSRCALVSGTAEGTSHEMDQLFRYFYKLKRKTSESNSNEKLPIFYHHDPAHGIFPRKDTKTTTPRLKEASQQQSHNLRCKFQCPDLPPNRTIFHRFPLPKGSRTNDYSFGSIFSSTERTFYGEKLPNSNRFRNMENR